MINEKGEELPTHHLNQVFIYNGQTGFLCYKRTSSKWLLCDHLVTVTPTQQLLPPPAALSDIEVWNGSCLRYEPLLLFHSKQQIVVVDDD